MPCCGHKRAKLTTTDTRSDVTRRADSPTPQADPRQVVRIRYLRESPIVVSGPSSGRQYVFSGRTPIQSVDAQDAPAFLTSALLSVFSLT